MEHLDANPQSIKKTIASSTGKSIAFFDFDGTITNRDSFFDFISFYRGKTRLYIGLLKLLPTLLAYKINIVPNWKAKEKVLTYFFKDEPVTKFQYRCDQYAMKRIPQVIREGAVQAIKYHQQLGHDIYVVSASPENWLSAWCQRKNLGLLATKLEVSSGTLTGKLRGNNCYGPEKVTRILSKVELANYDAIYSYGDSKGDREMLDLANHSYFRPFRS